MPCSVKPIYYPMHLVKNMRFGFGTGASSIALAKVIGGQVGK